MGRRYLQRQLIFGLSGIEEIYGINLFQAGTKFLNTRHGFGQRFGRGGI